MGVQRYGKIKVCLPEFSQIVLSPGPLIFRLRKLLKKKIIHQKIIYYLTGDPAIIGVACAIVADKTNGKFNLLKWDKQENLLSR